MAGPNIADVQISVLPDFSQAERRIKEFERRTVLNLKVNGGPALGKITGQVSEFDKSLRAANARVVAFGASVGIITGITTAIKGLVTQAISLDKTLVELNSIFGKSASSLGKFRDELFDIAKSTGQSFDVVADAAKEFARQGLTAEETAKRTADAMKLVRISWLDAAKSVETITAGLNTFNELLGDSTALVDKLTAVDARFAVSSKDLAEALSRVGNTAEEAGINFDQLLGAVTAVQQRTARGGAVIGNAFKTIFTRVQSADTIKQLEELGIAVQDVQGNLLPALDVLNQVAAKIDGLPDTQRNSIQKLLGGQYNINILKAQLADLSDANSVLARAANASANAQGDSLRRNEELNKSLAAQLNEAYLNIQRIAGIAGKDLFGPLIGKLTSNAGDLSNLFKEEDGVGIGEKVGRGLLKGIGNVIAGPGLALGAILAGKLTGQLAGFSGGAFKSVTGIGGPSQGVLDLEKGIAGVLSTNSALQRDISSGLLTRLQIEERIAAAIQQRIAAEKFESQLIRGAATNLSGRVGYNPNTTSFKNRAGGNIPVSNLPVSAITNEISGAKKAGYSIGPNNVRAMRAKIGGKQTTVVYNNKEKVIHNFGGSGEPAIIPPIRNYAGGFNKANVGSFIGNGLFRNVFDYEKDKVFSAPKSLASSIDVMKKAGRNVTPIEIEQLERAKAIEKVTRPGLQKILGLQGLGPKVHEILPSGAFIADKVSTPTLRKLLNSGEIDSKTSSNVMRRAQESLKRIGFNDPDIHESNVAYDAKSGRFQILDFARGYMPNIRNAAEGFGNMGPYGPPPRVGNYKPKLTLPSLNLGPKDVGDNRVFLPDLNAGFGDPTQRRFEKSYDNFANSRQRSRLGNFREGLNSSKIGQSLNGLSAFSYQTEAGQRRAGGVAAAGFGLSFAGPALASAFGASPQAERGIAGVTQGLGTFGALATLGPAGAVVGGLIGGFQALKGIVDNLVPSMEDLNEGVKKSSEKRQQGVQAATELARVNAELASPSLSQTQRDKLSEKQRQLIFGRDSEGSRFFKQKDIDAALKSSNPTESFASLGSNLARNDELKTNAGLIPASLAANFKSVGSLTRLSRSIGGKTTGNYFGIDQNKLEQASGIITGGLLNSSDFTDQNPKNRKSIIEAVGKLSRSGEKDFNKFIKESGEVLGEQGFKDAPEALKQIAKQLDAVVEKEESIRILQKAFGNLFIELSGVDKQLKVTTDKAKEFAFSFEDLQKQLDRNSKGLRKISAIRSGADGNIFDNNQNNALRNIRFSGVNDRLSSISGLKGVGLIQAERGIQNASQNQLSALKSENFGNIADLKGRGVTLGNNILKFVGSGSSERNKQLEGLAGELNSSDSLPALGKAIKEILTLLPNQTDDQKKAYSEASDALYDFQKAIRDNQNQFNQNSKAVNANEKEQISQARQTEALNRVLAGQAALMSRRGSVSDILGGGGSNFGVIGAGASTEINQLRPGGSKAYQNRLNSLNRRSGNSRTQGLVDLGNERLGESRTIASGIIEGFGSGALPTTDVLARLQAEGDPSAFNNASKIYNRNLSRLKSANFDILNDQSRKSLGTQISPTIGNLNRFVSGTRNTLQPGTQNEANLALQSNNFDALSRILGNVRGKTSSKNYAEIDRALANVDEARTDFAYNRQRANDDAIRTAGGLNRPLDVAAYKEGIATLNATLKGENTQGGEVKKLPVQKIEAVYNINVNGLQGTTSAALSELLVAELDKIKNRVVEDSLAPFRAIENRLNALETDTPPLPIR